MTTKTYYLIKKLNELRKIHADASESSLYLMALYLWELREPTIHSFEIPMYYIVSGTLPKNGYPMD